MISFILSSGEVGNIPVLICTFHIFYSVFQICDLTDNVIPKLKRDVEVKAKLLTKLKGERQEVSDSLGEMPSLY